MDGQVLFLLVNTGLDPMELTRLWDSSSHAHKWYQGLSVGSESPWEPISIHSSGTPAYDANEEIFLSRNKLQSNAELPSSCFSLHVLDAAGRVSRDPRLWQSSCPASEPCHEPVPDHPDSCPDAAVQPSAEWGPGPPGQYAGRGASLQGVLRRPAPWAGWWGSGQEDLLDSAGKKRPELDPLGMGLEWARGSSGRVGPQLQGPWW